MAALLPFKRTPNGHALDVTCNRVACSNHCPATSGTRASHVLDFSCLWQLLQV
jgi:hypothetical protein